MSARWMGSVSVAAGLLGLIACGGGEQATDTTPPPVETPVPVETPAPPPPPEVTASSGEMSPQLTAVVPKIPADMKDKTNPKAGDKAAIEAGKTTYTNICASCHGVEGKGDGPAAMALTPKPFNFTMAARLTPGQRFWVLKNGIEGTGMSAFGAAMDDDTVWSALAYIDTLASGGAASAPAAAGGGEPPKAAH